MLAPQFNGVAAASDDIDILKVLSVNGITPQAYNVATKAQAGVFRMAEKLPLLARSNLRLRSIRIWIHLDSKAESHIPQATLP